jgi:hypothetical protein
MALTAVRAVASNANSNGFCIAADGPYVVCGHGNTTSAPSGPGMHLWRRNATTGLLELLVSNWFPVVYQPTVTSRLFNSIDCWYNSAEARLEIIAGDPFETLKGACFFYDFPDSGTDEDDIVELGKLDGLAGTDMGGMVVTHAGRAIAATPGEFRLHFFSRVGDTPGSAWEIDEYDDTSYLYCNAIPPLDLTAHPTEPGAVLGLFSCEEYGRGTGGSVYVLKCSSAGVWSNPAVIAPKTPHSFETGRGAGIGPGANGGGTIAIDCTAYDAVWEGIAIYDMGADDTIWTYRGRQQSAGEGLTYDRHRPKSIVVGYNVIVSGGPRTWQSVGDAGLINATLWDSIVSEGWNVTDGAPGTLPEFVYGPPSPHGNESDMEHTNNMDIAYQSGGYVRVVTGMQEYKPGPPPGTGSVYGGVVEYNGDLDWPSPPNPTPVDQTYTISTVTVVSRDLIKLNFNSDVAVSSSLLDPDSYVVSGGVAVAAILPIEDDITTSVLLRLTPKAALGVSYEITIPSVGYITEYLPDDVLPSETIYTPDQVPIATMMSEWTHHRTKTDSMISNLSQMYSTAVGSNLFQVLAGLGISDEEIGGDQ